MSIAQDLAALQAGETDLVRRNYAGAMLAGGSYIGRDFYEATLQGADLTGADLSRCILSRAKLLLMRAPGANMSDIIARRTVFSRVDLSRSDLRRASLLGSVFTKVNLRGADLRGANFTAAVLAEGTTFEGSIVDETTRFDNAQVFGPLAAQDAFSFYEGASGRMVRRRAEKPAEAMVPEGLRHGAIREIDGLMRTLGDLASAAADDGSGRAAPPFAAVFLQTLLARLSAIRTDLHNPLPDRDRLEEASALLKLAGERLMAWVGTKVAQAARCFGTPDETPPVVAATSGLTCFRQIEAVWQDLKQIGAAVV